MKIINLLEGTEHLFHATEGSNIPSILNAGGVLMSHLMTSENESIRMKKFLGKNPKNIYYLSMARSMHSSYVRSSGELHSSNFAVFEFSGHKIAKLGKIIPFNYYNRLASDDTPDEMEDRLISDKGLIPFGLIECVHVCCIQSYVDDYKHFHDVTGVNVIFYDNLYSLFIRRNGKTYEQFKKQGSEVKAPTKYKANVKDTFINFCEFILKDLRGERQTYEAFTQAYEPIKTVPLRLIISQVSKHNFGLAHEILVRLKKDGYDKPPEMSKYMSDLVSSYSKLKPRDLEAERKQAEEDDKLLSDLGAWDFTFDNK